MPDWKSIVRERLNSLSLDGAAASDVAAELAQHLEDRYAEYLGAGASEQEAYEKAAAELNDMRLLGAKSGRARHSGNHDAARPGDSGTGNLLQGLGKDLRGAVRAMRKNPLFAVFVVLTLALGIGANTAVFTLINTFFLNALPVQDPSGLGAVGAAKAARTPAEGVPLPISWADLKEFQARNDAFQSLAGYTSPRIVTWQGNSGSERLFTELVTANYFSTLGLHPARGRFFSPEDDSAPGAHAVAVVNYAAWQTRFGAEDNIVGRTLRLNNVVFTVIGVAPSRFIGVNALFGPDLWIPASMAERLLPNEMQNALGDRGKTLFQAVGRLRSGTEHERAQANLATVASDLAREYPATNEGRTAIVRPIRQVLFASANGGSEQVFAATTGLSIVVLIVLLIACSNVANLLLARSAARRQEMAVRLAMGASRERLARQVLTESIFLGFLSGGCGFVVAWAGLRLLFGSLPGTANFITPKLDLHVFAFALVISLATGLLFGTIPAFKASRVSVAETLKQEARTTGRSRNRVTIANTLLVSQIAFSLVLLVTAALFLRSIQRAYRINPGFQTEHLAVFMTNPGQAGYSRPRTKAFYKDVRERVSRIPGIESVSWSSNLPLWARKVNGLEVEGWQQRAKADVITTVLNTVDVDYFVTAGVAIDRGRAFAAVDQENSAPVAIVNEKLARDFWPGGEALGKRIHLPGEKQMRQIVGIARNASYSTWAEPPQICVYVPLEQNYSDAMTLYVRTRGDPKDILMPVQREVHAAAPQILASDMRTGHEIVDGGLFQVKVGVTLLSVFGLLALGLASIGLYGIVAYSVGQRKREIGLRMALGAARGAVLRFVLKQGMSLVLVGVTFGLAAAFLTDRLLGAMLYGVAPDDPLSIAAAAAVLCTVALAACYLPARGASRVDPLVALREE